MQIYKGNKYYPNYLEPSGGVTAVAFGIVRISDGYWYDFSDSTFKASGWTTQYQSMTENQNGLWVYASGWTTPNTTGQYRVNYKVTDAEGIFYAAGEELNVTAITPQVYTETATPTTTAELLTAVEAAIKAKITGGAVASYRIGDEEIRNMSLSELRAFRDQLRRELSAASGDTRTYARIDNPT